MLREPMCLRYLVCVCLILAGCGSGTSGGSSSALGGMPTGTGGVPSGLGGTFRSDGGGAWGFGGARALGGASSGTGGLSATGGAWAGTSGTSADAGGDAALTTDADAAIDAAVTTDVPEIDAGPAPNWRDVSPVRNRVGPQTLPRQLFASEVQLGAYWETPSGDVLTTFRTSITQPTPGVAIDDSTTRCKPWWAARSNPCPILPSRPVVIRISDRVALDRIPTGPRCFRW
jgi:hypothetical protein